MNTKRFFILLLMVALSASFALAQASLSLTSVNPQSVISTQSTTITLTGTGFIEETSVQLSGIGTVSDTFVNATTLTVALPQALSAGTYTISVTNPGGESASLTDALTVTEPLKIISSEPQKVVSTQPTSVTIVGTGFIEETSVQLSGIGTVNDTFVNATTLTVALPQALSAGTYTISVNNPGGESASLTDALTVTEPLKIISSEPLNITAGQPHTLSVLGSGFTTGAVVRLVGFGILETTVLHSGALTAIIPESIPAGQYTIEVSDTSGNVAQSPDTLRVADPPLPTVTPQPLPTPLTIRSTPNLSISTYTATPNSISAGQTSRMTFTVQNRGNQWATAITVTLENDSNFVVSGGQSSIAIPDLAPGAVYTASMQITATQDASPGAAPVPLNISYRDFAGESYTADAALSLTIMTVTNQPQVVIDAYTIDPDPVEPGAPVIVRLTLVNHGNTVANQVSMRIAGSDSILLPNGSGDTVVVGDLQPNVPSPLQISLLVDSEAKNGVQTQPITISYFQNGEAKETSTSITINVVAANEPQPLLLLASYTTGADVLTPGTRFTLGITLHNVGTAPAQATTVTFGTVQSSGDGGSGDSGTSGGSSTSTTPSTTFAPLGTAGLSYVGDIAADTTVAVDQEFIVAGDVSSGIYSLPITLNYLLPDATSKQAAFNLSIVVIAPPRLRFNPQNPLPEMVSAGEPIPIMLEIVNLGRYRVDFTEAAVTTDNGEIFDGASIQLEPLAVDDDMSLESVIMPLEEGTMTVTITLSYLNELGQVETIELSYSAEVAQPPPVIEEPFEPMPSMPEPEPEEDWFGRIIMAIMGLGS